MNAQEIIHYIATAEKKTPVKITLREKRFGFEPEVTIKLARQRCRMYEVTVSYSGRTYQEGKKINWKDGVSALRCILKYGLLRMN